MGKKKVKIVIDIAHIRDGMKAMGEAAGCSFERALDKNVNTSIDINFDSTEYVGACREAVDKFAKVCYCAFITAVLCTCIAAIGDCYVQTH